MLSSFKMLDVVYFLISLWHFNEYRKHTITFLKACSHQNYIEDS